MVQASPYTPGELAREVPGREALLLAIRGDVARLSVEHRLAGRIRVLHGARGYGKTSLLRKAERAAVADGVDTVWVTAEEGHLFAASLLTSIEAKADELGIKDRDVRKAIAGLKVSMGVQAPGGLAKGEVSYTFTDPPAKSAKETREFEQLIVKMTRVLAKHGGRGLALFVDEVQNTDRRGIQLLSYGIAHLQAEHPDVPFAIIAAGLPSCPTVITAAVSNSERFAYDAVPPLPELDVKRALAEPAYTLGVTWQPDALSLAARWAAGYPYSVQLVGHQAWVAADYPDSGAVVGVGHVEAAIAAAQRELAELHAARYGRIHGEVERALLRAMASLGDGPVARSAIAEAMGRTSAAISNQRASLIGKGIIEPADHGRLQFTVPGFAEYLRTSVDD